LLRVRRVRAVVRVRANQTLVHAPIADRSVTVEIVSRSQSPLP
jgi:hypothetical protein